MTLHRAGLKKQGMNFTCPQLVLIVAQCERKIIITSPRHVLLEYTCKPTTTVYCAVLGPRS